MMHIDNNYDDQIKDDIVRQWKDEFPLLGFSLIQQYLTIIKSDIKIENEVYLWKFAQETFLSKKKLIHSKINGVIN